MLAIGGAGHLSCVANFAPQPVAELYDRFAAGEHAAAAKLHYALHPLVELAFLETNPGPVKWAMERLGILRSGYARAPLAPLSEAARRRAEELLTASGCVPVKLAPQGENRLS
jgi:4-hydroxy-tetrahydrodipicolinate synthase